jgi:EF-P beta-lysylation protein EpmB
MPAAAKALRHRSDKLHFTVSGSAAGDQSADPCFTRMAQLVPTPQSAARGESAASDLLTGVSSRQSWQRELSAAYRNVDELLAALDLQRPDLVAAGMTLGPNSEFPLLVPDSFLQRMRPGDPHDPLLLQVLPQAVEKVAADGFVTDAVHDQAARRASGMLQKYHGRVLLMASGSCAVHCRYCFRREYPYSHEPHRLPDWEPAVAEIAADSSVSEVIFSGGDPWMLNDGRLAELCRRVDTISHIERIRFHTRLPIVLPSRVTTSLIELLQSLRAQAIVVVHANHAHELDGDCAVALGRLVRSGGPVLNQSVLLRGVNDSVVALEELSRALTKTGIMPYYLHQLDRVSGTSHFEVSVQRGQQLIRELQQRLPGYAVPRYVQEIPGEPHKTLLT